MKKNEIFSEANHDSVKKNKLCKSVWKFRKENCNLIRLLVHFTNKIQIKRTYTILEKEREKESVG